MHTPGMCLKKRNMKGERLNTKKGGKKAKDEKAKYM